MRELARRVAVDGGQSGTRVRVELADGSTRRFDAAPVSTDRPVVPQIAAAAASALEELGIGAAAVAAGVTGLTAAGADAPGLRSALASLGVRRAALAHDSVSAYLAANGFERGAVTAVGTGVVTLGVGTTTARIDGWGYLFGDAGSAYWIGRAGLDAALRAFDGRAPHTVLLDALRERFGDPAELYMTVQADPARVSVVAGFAEVVAAVAEAGDRAAAAVIGAAGAELAASVCAALAGSGADDAPRVSHVGTVLERNAVLRAALAERVLARFPDARVEPPRGDPLDGVAALLDASSGHPLAALIDTAEGDG